MGINTFLEVSDNMVVLFDLESMILARKFKEEHLVGVELPAKIFTFEDESPSEEIYNKIETMGLALVFKWVKDAADLIFTSSSSTDENEKNILLSFKVKEDNHVPGEEASED